jgi:hypothetical protein
MTQITTNFEHPLRKLTNKEFRSIPRDSLGDIESHLLSDAWIFATPSQKKSLSGDDQTRGDWLDEELRCMAAEL